MSEEDFDSRLEEFGKNPVGRALLQLMPGGASLDAAMSARVSQLHDARHEWEARREQAALMDLIEWLNELDQTKLDRAYITSDQFGDDFLEWYERTVHTSNTQKREALRNALLNGATIEWQGTGLRDLFMPLVVDFSPTQIQVLQTIAVCQRPPREDEERFSDRNLVTLQAIWRTPWLLLTLDDWITRPGALSA